MGLINWSKDNEYEKSLRQRYKEAGKRYYAKHKDELNAKARRKREYEKHNKTETLYKRWSELYTEDERELILKYIQNEIDICKKKDIVPMKNWWRGFKGFVYNDSLINLTDAGEFWCFMDVMQFKRGFDNKEIREKAKKYYFHLTNEKLIKVYGDLDTRNAKEVERIRNCQLQKEKEKRREASRLYRERQKQKIFAN